VRIQRHRDGDLGATIGGGTKDSAET